MPLLSETAAEYIENYITASMEAIDGSSKQYELPIILSDVGEKLPKEDRVLLEGLLEEGVDYIEI